MATPSFDELIDHLQNNPDPSVRGEAIRLIVAMAPSLGGAQRQLAKDALNFALSDPDPMVLMAAMQALAAFSAPMQDSGEGEDADAPIAEAATCVECGRPEFVVRLAACDQCGNPICEEHWLINADDPHSPIFCSQACVETYFANE